MPTTLRVHLHLVKMNPKYFHWVCTSAVMTSSASVAAYETASFYSAERCSSGAKEAVAARPQTVAGTGFAARSRRVAVTFSPSSKVDVSRRGVADGAADGSVTQYNGQMIAPTSGGELGDAESEVEVPDPRGWRGLR
jgi:hypothetical protein